MNSKGIEVKPTINSKGEMQGMRFLHKSSGTDLKASELGKAFGTRNLIDRGVNLTKMPLPANMAEIARKAVKIVVQTIDRGRGMSMGF
jgi:relaxase-like protein